MVHRSQAFIQHLSNQSRLFQASESSDSPEISLQTNYEDLMKSIGDIPSPQHPGQCNVEAQHGQTERFFVSSSSPHPPLFESWHKNSTNKMYACVYFHSSVLTHRRYNWSISGRWPFSCLLTLFMFKADAPGWCNQLKSRQRVRHEQRIGSKKGYGNKKG